MLKIGGDAKDFYLLNLICCGFSKRKRSLHLNILFTGLDAEKFNG